MKFAYCSLAAILASLLLGASLTGSAGAKTTPHADAVKACQGVDGLESAAFVAAVDDGRGAILVWLTDSSSSLWMCSASAEGQVFAYAEIAGDLLEGEGASFANGEIEQGDGDVVPPEYSPLTVAELACKAYLSDTSEGEVIGSGLDGLDGDWIPGYFVFLEADQDKIFLCDATGDGQVWAFAEIGDPMDLEAHLG